MGSRVSSSVTTFIFTKIMHPAPISLGASVIMIWFEFVPSLLQSERFSPGITVCPSHEKTIFDLI